MKDIFRIEAVPFDEEKHRKLLEKWREIYNRGDQVLMLPNGYSRIPGVVTNIAKSGDGRILGSLTGTHLIGLDPFIKNPNATPFELLQALFMLCRSLEVDAARGGAQEAYIAIPNDEIQYQEMMQKVGFVETAQGCKIYRHQFFPEVEVKE